MNVFWMCVQRLRCFVVGCNNEYSSCHLLPTSEPLKAHRINVTFVFEGNAPIPICLNVSMFAQIIGDAASSTEGVSIRVFMNLCKSPFLITVPLFIPWRRGAGSA